MDVHAHLFMYLSPYGSKRSMSSTFIIIVLAMAWHIYANGCTVRELIATNESSSPVLAGFFGAFVSSCAWGSLMMW
jgi:hypothetical protein